MHTVLACTTTCRTERIEAVAGVALRLLSISCAQSRMVWLISSGSTVLSSVERTSLMTSTNERIRALENELRDLRAQAMTEARYMDTGPYADQLRAAGIPTTEVRKRELSDLTMEEYGRFREQFAWAHRPQERLLSLENEVKRALTNDIITAKDQAEAVNCELTEGVAMSTRGGPGQIKPAKDEKIRAQRATEKTYEIAVPKVFAPKLMAGAELRAWTPSDITGTVQDWRREKDG